MNEHIRNELNAPRILGEPIDGEVMLIDLDSGTYFSLRGAAAAAWPWLVAGATPIEIASAWAGEGDARSLASGIAAFATRMREENVLLVRNADHPLVIAKVAALASDADIGDFAFERFDDMRAMLVADPVHGVSERGWPDVATPKG